MMKVVANGLPFLHPILEVSLLTMENPTKPEASNPEQTKSKQNPDQLADTLKGLQDQVKSLKTELEGLNTKGNPDNRNTGPYVTSGESINSSRGFSFVKALGAMAGQGNIENCKIEVDLCNRLKKQMYDEGYQTTYTNGSMLPMSADFLNENGNSPLVQEIRERVKAGVSGYDPDQARYELGRLSNHYARSKALSYVDESTGASLIAPPLQGELIDLLRNNEVFMQAGARTVGMPPNGRIVFPRQTGAGTAYWVSSSSTITDSTPTTGEVVLQAKKLGMIVKIPNELFRFASVSIEMFVREDISRVLSLKMDKSFLDAVGSSTEPKGLINYSNISSHTASTTGANGDTFEPEDVNLFVSKVEENNASFNAFVMRPQMYAAISNRRADAVSAGDGAGRFMFDTDRTIGGNWADVSRMRPGSLNGYPVFKSTQVSNTESKGGASDLTMIIGGDFTDYIIAMSGAMEFQVSNQGDTPFQSDQTWYRGILYVDGAPRHEASFVWTDSLING